MKAIRRSYKPIMRQMPVMASNLKEITGRNSSIEISSSSWDAIIYSIYMARTDIEEATIMNFKSWKECQEFYGTIVEGGLYG